MDVDVASTPVTLAIAASILWGFWAFFVKLSTRTIDPLVVLLLTYGTSVIVGGAWIAVTRPSLSVDATGVGFALVAGVATALGSVLYYTSLDQGAVGTASIIVGLYFVVATLLAVVFIDEPFTAKKAAGLVLAVAAVALLAS